MSREMNEELWKKLLEAQSSQDAEELLRADGAEYTEEEASQIRQEIEQYKADKKQAGKEEAVFVQNVSLDEMEGVAGGQQEDQIFVSRQRNIYGGKGFANCAATVESGSWCHSNDACWEYEVVYTNRTYCAKAWE